MELDGKTAFVTGAGSGIGRASALAMAQAGARVAVVDINMDQARQTAGLISDNGGHAVAIAGDVCDELAMADAVKQCVEQFGSLDCALNNAGILGQLSPFEDQPITDFRRVVEVNLMGTVICAQAEITQMLLQTDGGAIVNMASCAGLVGWENATAYVASKHAVVGLTKTLGLEFGARGIRINAVCPSFVVTAMTDAILESPEVEAGAVAKHPIGRLGKPGEIAEAVVYLLSSRASFMSGSSMVVDGGYSAQ